MVFYLQYLKYVPINFLQGKLMNISFYKEGEFPLEYKERFKAVREYVTKFLVSKHPARSGSVCPFVEKSLQEESFWWGVVDFSQEKNLEIVVSEAIDRQKKNTISVPGGAMILVFKNPVKHRLLGKVHKKKFLEALALGLMVADFGPSSDYPSIHQKNFYPFRAPEVILVIRDLIPHDLQFLRLVRWRKRRIAAYQAFISRFKDQSNFEKYVNIARRELSALQKNCLFFW
jgi:hypothetical protein